PPSSAKDRLARTDLDLMIIDEKRLCAAVDACRRRPVGRRSVGNTRSPIAIGSAARRARLIVTVAEWLASVGVGHSRYSLTLRVAILVAVPRSARSFPSRTTTAVMTSF